MVTKFLDWYDITDDNYIQTNEEFNKNYKNAAKIKHEMKDDDIMEMQLDCYKWTLSFTFINNDDSTEYIERTNIEPKEYRLKIHLAAISREVCYQLLDYQMTY